MFNVFGSFIQKRRYLVTEEANVMDIVKVIDQIKRTSKIHTMMNMELGNCDWKDEPDMWFIHFDVTDRQWRKAMGMTDELGYQIVLRNDDKLYLTKKLEAKDRN